MFSAAIILGGISRPDIGAGWNATLAVLFAGLGVVAIAYTISLYARRYAGAGAVYEYLTHGAHPWVGVLTAGFFFAGALFLGGGGIYLGLGILSDGFWKAHISDSGPAWWVWGLIMLGIVLILNHVGVRLAIRAMLAFAAVSFVPMLVLALVIIGKGGEGGNTLSMFNWGETSLFGITGGGVLGGVLLGILLFVGFEAAASIGEESKEPHRSIPRALIVDRRRRGGVLRLHGVRLLDRLRQGGRRQGRVGVLAVGRRRAGTKYIGSWYATILDLIVILDATALALAICVMIGRGFFALGRDGLLPKVFAKTSRYDTPWVGNLMVAVGGIGLIVITLRRRTTPRGSASSTRQASSCRSSRTTSSRISSCPRRSGRSRSSSSTSCSRSPRFASSRRAGTSRGSTWSLPSRSQHRSSASTARSPRRRTTARTTTGGALLDDRADRGGAGVVRDRAVDAAFERRQRGRSRGGAPRRAPARREPGLPAVGNTRRMQTLGEVDALTWHPVGPAEDVSDGTLRRAEIGERAVCIGRVDGRLGGLRRHVHPRGVLALGRRARRHGVVVCPCHGSEFDIRTGDVLCPPALEPLPIYETRRGRGTLLVRLAPPAAAAEAVHEREDHVSAAVARLATVAAPSVEGIVLDDVDLTDLDVWEQRVPHDWLTLLRREAPLHWHPEHEGRGFWVFTRYDDIVEVSKDWETYSSELGGTSLQDLTPEEIEARKSMLDTDPPAHTRLRAIVNKGFTPRVVNTYEERIRGLARGILVHALQRDELDWVEDVAAEIPMWVFSEIMGLPVEDRKLLIELGDKLLGNSDPEVVGEENVAERALTDPELRKLPFSSPFALDLIEYGCKLGEARRHEPRDDITTKLVEADVDGSKLTEHEFGALLHPPHDGGQRDDAAHDQPRPARSARAPGGGARLVADPSLAGAAADEILRRAHPCTTSGVPRPATSTVHGRRIKAGDKVTFWYASGNYDEEPLR